MKKINVLIIDDSAFMRKLIADLLSEDPRIQIAGTARNGEDGIKKVQELKPDVVTMDVEMPILNGLDALKQIMADHPVPVLMLSSTTQQGAENTILAISYGAVDFISKPSGAISLDLHKIKTELIEKVISASNVNVKRLVQLPQMKKNAALAWKKYSKMEPKAVESVPEVQGAVFSKSAKKIVCIGTSTGGPRALQSVITKLPAHIHCPIVIVQHMPPGFTKSLANRLDQLAHIRVTEAVDGEMLENGTAYIAPGGFHLKVEKSGQAFMIRLNQSEPRGGHRPSVDVLFESISEVPELNKIAVIMTGMGSDGTKGLLALKNSGNTVAIAESEESCIVYGMPKSAIATEKVDEVKNVQEIAETILKYV